jgi:hypothetical protein
MDRTARLSNATPVPFAPLMLANESSRRDANLRVPFGLLVLNYLYRYSLPRQARMCPQLGQVPELTMKPHARAEGNPKYVEDYLRQEFEHRLKVKVDRTIRVPVQQFAPAHYFAEPTQECRRMFVDGHFFGCITLTQSVAEAIARFVLSKNPQVVVNDPTDHAAVVNALQKDHSSPVISRDAFAAFREIRGPRKRKDDRNAYHHLTNEIELDCRKRERRAEQCLKALYEIEAEIFAYEIRDGNFVFANPRYWQINPTDKTVRVMARR